MALGQDLAIAVAFIAFEIGDLYLAARLLPHVSCRFLAAGLLIVVTGPFPGAARLNGATGLTNALCSPTTLNLYDVISAAPAERSRR